MTASAVGARLRDRRGTVLVLVAVSMTAMLALVALAVDVGLLYAARGEAQNAADAAALAGAGSFLEAPGDPAAASALAEEVGERNLVRNESVDIRPGEDVTVEPERERVTVTVRRLAARGNAVPTYFARLIGFSSADVSATATAEAVVAGMASCLTPLAPPDGFEDANGDGVFEAGDRYDPETTGYGTRARDGAASENGVDPAGTTYAGDFGRPLVLEEGSPATAPASDRYLPVQLPPAGEGSAGPPPGRGSEPACASAPVRVGQALAVAAEGAAGASTRQLAEFVALDRGARWDPGAREVVGSRYRPWRASPRVVTIPLFDPSHAPDRAGGEIRLSNVSALWIEGVAGGEVVGRLLYASGVPAAGGGPGEGNVVGPALKAVRLIR